MPAHRPLPTSSALTIAVPAAATLALVQVAGGTRWVHEPLHSSLETAGGVIALTLAAVLLWRQRYGTPAPHLRWVCMALVCMGLQDLAHAWLRQGPAFYWSRALPTLLGGLLMALVWLPPPAAGAPARAERLPVAVGLLTLPLCLSFLLVPNTWPMPFTSEGAYAGWARAVNVVGGVGFALAAAFFLRRHVRAGAAPGHASEDVVLANHCLLFAGAGVLFGVSHIWGSTWWMFHALRLVAYAVVLVHAVGSYRGLQAAEEAALVREREQTATQLRLVTDALPVLVSFLRPDGTYGYTNRAYTAWFGLGGEELRGRRVRDVVGEAAWAAAAPHFERALSGDPVTFERVLPYRLGGERHVRASYMPQHGADGRVEGVVALVTDVTAERRAQARAERLQAVTSAVSRALTPEDVAHAVLAEATRGAGAQTGTLFALDAEEGPLRLLGAVGVSSELAAQLATQPLTLEMPSARVVRTGAPEWLTTREELLGRSPASRPSVEASGNAAWAALPLPGSGGPMGSLVLGFHGARTLDAQDQAFLLALAQQAGQALERAGLYRAAQEAVRIREDFLSVAGHELRTPLTSLKLQLRLLARGLPGTALTRLVTIDRQVGRLESLVASLLDVARLSAGRLQLELSEVDLAALVREVLERLADDFARAGCAVHLDAPGPVTGAWDAQRLDQVLVNLLSNAAKYGAGKPVHVAVHAEGEAARVTVRDEGIGISVEALPRLFGRFERAVSDRQYGGLGLGLYISRQLVEAMGGTIQVTSTPGAGASFVVTLPRGAAASPRA